MKCSACGREQPGGGLFCQFCGASVSAPASGPWTAGTPSGSGLCACGRSLTPRDQFCPGCGRARVQVGQPSSGGFGAASPAQGRGMPSGGYPPQGAYPPQGVYPPQGNVPAGGPPGSYPPGGAYTPSGYLPAPGYGQSYLPVPAPSAQMYPYGRKDKVAAGVLGLLLGGFGVHKFYLRQPGLGILYLLFCWTPVPWIAGLIEGITYLTQSEQSFDSQYNYRF